MKYLENASSKLTNFCSQDVLNFTFILTKPEDGQWGALQPDGSWTGMVKLLQDHDLDIAVTDFTGESNLKIFSLVLHERSLFFLDLRYVEIFEIG